MRGVNRTRVVLLVLGGCVVWLVIQALLPRIDDASLRQAITQRLTTQGLRCAGCSVATTALSAPTKTLLGGYAGFNVWVFVYDQRGIQTQGLVHVEPETDPSAAGSTLVVGPLVAKDAVIQDFAQFDEKDQARIRPLLEHPEWYCCEDRPPDGQE